MPLVLFYENLKQKIIFQTWKMMELGKIELRDSAGNDDQILYV